MEGGCEAWLEGCEALWRCRTRSNPFPWAGGCQQLPQCCAALPEGSCHSQPCAPQSVLISSVINKCPCELFRWSGLPWAWCGAEELHLSVAVCAGGCLQGHLKGAGSLCVPQCCSGAAGAALPLLPSAASSSCCCLGRVGALRSLKRVPASRVSLGSHHSWPELWIANVPKLETETLPPRWTCWKSL